MLVVSSFGFHHRFALVVVDEFYGEHVFVEDVSSILCILYCCLINVLMLFVCSFCLGTCFLHVHCCIKSTCCFVFYMFVNCSTL